MSRTTPARGLSRAALGAGLALGLSAAARRGTQGSRLEAWQRTNYRGRPVSLTAGPALAGAASLSFVGQPAGLLAGAGAGLIGSYDDHAGQGHAKGLRGHLGALGRGEVTSGAVKLGTLAALGLVSAGLAPGRARVLDRLMGGAVVAGTANLLNLLDLRPGRALKTGVASALILRQPGVAGACAALLPGDLAERTMLGDAGANALGAVLGSAYLAREPSRTSTTFAVGGLVLLTGLSEVCSYSALIDRIGPLRWLDELGRAR